MSNQRNNPMTRGQRVWLVWLCVVLFASACIAEPAHFHPASGPSRQHCSLCIASHSVARPAPLVSAVATPAHCLGVLVSCGAAIPDFETVLSLYIRPPPAL